jgi:hypothetical protein
MVEAKYIALIEGVVDEETLTWTWPSAWELYVALW